MSADDRTSLFDLHAVVEALEKAEDALRKAMAGQEPTMREEFTFQIGLAYGRLGRVCNRIYARPPVEAPPSYICPGCRAVSYNPNDIQARYCERCHQFGDDDNP